MKVWVEWRQNDSRSYGLPQTPNVFTSIENVFEFWRRTQFPSDAVDRVAASFATQVDKRRVNHEDRYAELVEVDEYFVKKAKELAKEGMEVKQ